MFDTVNKLQIVVAVVIIIFSVFNICSSSENCLSAKCASAANAVCRDMDVFGTTPLSLKHNL
jgi:hypothetical protein